MTGFRDTAFRRLGRFRYRDADNVTQEARRVWFRDADNVTRLAWAKPSPMTAAASPAVVNGAQGANFATLVATTTTTVTVTGGTAPYSYAWEQASGGLMWAIVTANGASTRFEANGLTPGQTEVATFICTVTDRDGNEATTAPVQAQATNFGDPFGGPLP